MAIKCLKEFEISKKLKEYRKRNNLSVDYVSEKIGINRATIYRYETGEIKNIPYNHLLSLCELYNVDIHDFIEQDSANYEANDFKSKVGELIASRRKELGMTQAELAQKSGYSNKSSIATIESGIIDVPASKAIDLAKALNVDPNYFFCEDVDTTEVTVKNTITGERLKILREKLKMSQVDVADKVGVSKQTLYKYENGIIGTIPYDKIYNFAKLYNVSPSYLVGWKNEIGSGKSTGQNIDKDLNSMSDIELLELINKASSIMYSRKKSSC